MTEDLAPGDGQAEAADESAPPEGQAPDTTPGPLDEGFNPDSLPEELQPGWKQIQADYTRKTQELAEQRKEAESAVSWIDALQDPETRDDAFGQLAEMFGVEFAKDALEGADDGDSDEEQPEFKDPRVDDLIAEREEARFETMLDQIEKDIESEIGTLAEAAKIDLTEIESELIFDKTLALEPLADGKPNVEAAFKRVTGLRDEVIKNYRSKKRDKPSPPAKGGSSGEPSNSPKNDKERRQLALEVANRAFDSSS